MNRSPGAATGTSFDARAIASAAPLNSTVEVEVGPQAGRVRQQVPDGDARPCRTGRIRDERGHRIAQPDAPLLHQLHHAGRRRDDLGQRGEIEDRVFGHRLARGRDGAIAEGRVIDDSSPRPISTTAPGNSSRAIAASNEAADRPQIRRRPACRRRRRGVRAVRRR